MNKTVAHTNFRLLYQAGNERLGAAAFLKEGEKGKWQRQGISAFFVKNAGMNQQSGSDMCPACREWNTASEEPVAKTKTAKGKGAPVHIVSDGKNEPSKLADINTKETDRMSTGIKELDRVLGGGIVAGSLVLVGGDPGIGKSTLLLQMCKNLSHMDKNVLYISGEESLKQIKMRAERIGTFTDKLLLYVKPIWTS